MDGECLKKMTLTDGLIVVGVLVAFGYVMIVKLNEKENSTWMAIQISLKSWWNSGKEKMRMLEKPQEVTPEMFGDTTQIL